MQIQNNIIKKLTSSLTPMEIKVVDESQQHAGHSGAREGGETHFAVFVKSDKFVGLSRLERHKLIYTILDAEMKGGVHALRISAKAPEEK